MNSLSQEVETTTLNVLEELAHLIRLVKLVKCSTFVGPKNPGQNEDENLVLEMSNFHFSTPITLPFRTFIVTLECISLNRSENLDELVKQEGFL